MTPNNSSGFIVNVLKLVGGNTFAQALGILVLPVLTRFFEPSAFGVAALFTSITGVFGVIACMRYELAIMLPHDDGEAINILVLCLLASLVVSVVIAVVVAIAGDGVVVLLHAPELSLYLWLIPLSVFFSGVLLGFTYWNVRTRQFGQVSLVQALSSVVAQSMKILAGFAGFICAGALIVAGILGTVASAGTLVSHSWFKDRGLFLRKVSIKAMLKGLRRYSKFPLFSSWSILLNIMSQQLPVWILSVYFSSSMVGYFSLSRIVLGAPVVLIGGAISQVFYQKACEVKDNPQDFSLAVDVIFSRLVSLGIFPLLLMMVIGQELFALVFGSRWVEAGVFTQILSLWIFFQFISMPLSNVFSVFERQKSLLFFNVVLFTTRLLSLILGGMTGDIYLTLMLFAGTGVGCYAWYCLWILVISGLPLRRGLYLLGRYGLFSTLLIVLVLFTESWTHMSGLWLLMAALGATLIYYLVVIEQDQELKLMRHRVLRRLGLVK